MNAKELYDLAQTHTFNDHPNFNVERAIELFSEVLALEPDHPFALEERSRCYRRLNKSLKCYEDLVALHKKAHNEDQKRRHAIDIAVELNNLGRHEEGLKWLIGLDLSPERISTYGLTIREQLFRKNGYPELADKDKAQIDAYNAAQQSLWDDPLYYGHYK